MVVWPAHAGRTGQARFEKQLQKFLTMIVWRLAGMNLHCKCFLIFFFFNNPFSSPDYAAFCNGFPPLFCSCSTDKHCTWYHALPHVKENMLNREENMWFGLAAVLIYRI